MNLRPLVAAAAVCTWAVAGTAAHAADKGDPYTGLMGLGYFSDKDLHLDSGGGARLYFGLPLLSNLNLEINAFGYGADPDSDALKYVKQYGAGLDLMVPFTRDTTVTPFFLIGGGYDRSEGGGSGRPDVLFSGHGHLDNSYANAGLGALIKLSHNWGIRVEGRYVALFPDSKGNFPRGRYDDALAGIGLQYTFGQEKVASPPPEPAPPPPPPPPPPAPKDTDGDGVLDPDDQCPNTPQGVQVDVRGCPLDSDGDGVPDYLDKCPNTTKGLKVDATGCVHEAQTIVLRNVNFEFNKDTLTRNSLDILKGVAKGLNSQRDLRVEIAGHTDNVGTDAYNESLSHRRAMAVRNYLVSQGVAARQLIAQGYGESRPVASNDTESGRAENRRVEFRVLKK